MNYHVRITRKSKKTSDEVRLDLSEEELRKRFIEPYEAGEPIIVNGRTIPIDDVDRIRVSASEIPSADIIGRLRAEDRDSPVIVFGGPSYEWQAADRAKDVTDSLIVGPPGSKKTKSSSGGPTKAIQKSSARVFIVHGHDHALKSDLEVFCREIGLEPIVLHRQADEGLTVIEKFEQHADVQYAFVLLTPDDIGYAVSEANKDEKDRSVELRARQNVIFEFGYFAGRLGRSKVCCVYKKGVRLPSDLGGLIYKEVASSIEEIGYAIIRELRAAGMKVQVA